MPHTIILAGEAQRQRAKAMIDRAPPGHVVRITEPRRTLEQNDLMWTLLTDISRAKPDGRRATPDVWKCLFMQACGHETQFEMGLDGKPFPTGFASSKLKKAQMSDLIEFIYSYGAQWCVAWSSPA